MLYFFWIQYVCLCECSRIVILIIHPMLIVELTRFFFVSLFILNVIFFPKNSFDYNKYRVRELFHNKIASKNKRKCFFFFYSSKIRRVVHKLVNNNSDTFMCMMFVDSRLSFRLYFWHI